MSTIASLKENIAIIGMVRYGLPYNIDQIIKTYREEMTCIRKEVSELQTELHKYVSNRDQDEFNRIDTNGKLLVKKHNELQDELFLIVRNVVTIRGQLQQTWADKAHPRVVHVTPTFDKV